MGWIGRLLVASDSGNWRSWITALALLGLGLAIRVVFASFFDTIPFLAFFPIVILAPLCGWRPAVAVLLLSALVAWYFFLPAGSGVLPDRTAVIRLVAYLVIGGMFIALVTVLRHAIRRLDEQVHLQESLFQELRHRVANNMQIVASMLYQTRRELRDPEAAALIGQAEARLSSMALLHRRLYDPAAHEGGLEPLLRDLLDELFRDLTVTVDLAIAPCRLSVDQMTALVLLVVEAATNAAKHVFRPALGSRFAVALTPLADGRLRLRIADDGPGAAPPREPEGRTLGMSIMRAFARQLGGTLDMEREAGTVLTVTFSPRAAERGRSEGHHAS